MPLGFALDAPPLAAIAYLKEKRPELHFDYDEIMHEAHHRAFTVAKVTKLDLLSDIQTSLVEAQTKGQSFKEWKASIEPTLQKHGWWGKTDVANPKTGEVKTITVGSRRLKTIYDTNMRTANARGRYQSQMLSRGQYLRYSAILDQRTRPKHREFHGLILPKDHPWWDTNYPPNGWRCRCKTNVYTQRDLDAKGWKVAQIMPENIADKDWAYHTGKIDPIQKVYADKVEALKENCDDGKNAKKVRPCNERQHDVAKKEYEDALEKIAASIATFAAVKELFATKEEKIVELCKSDLFGKEKRVLLSSDTVQRHEHHPEIGALDYSLVPFLLEGRAFIQKENTYVIIKKLGKYYRVALKNVEKTDEIFIVSLVSAERDEKYEKWIRELSQYEEIKRDKR